MSICRTFSVTWKEGTELMTQLAMDTECRRPSPTLIDSIVHLDPKQCKRKSRVVLANMLAEAIGLWYYCREKVGEFFGS